MIDEKQLKEFVKLLRKNLQDKIHQLEALANNIESPMDDDEEFIKSVAKILSDLVRNPGGLIYVEDREAIPLYKLAIDEIYEMYSDLDILNMLCNGDFDGFINEIEQDIVYQAKSLKPTFVSIKPSNDEFYVFYNEAMKCWLNGLGNSAVILSSTLLENLLKDQIEKLNPEETLEIIETDKNPKAIALNFEKVINVAEDKGVLSTGNKKKAHNIRKIRNKIVHEGFNIDPKSAFGLIRDTKDILEEILN